MSRMAEWLAGIGALFAGCSLAAQTAPPVPSPPAPDDPGIVVNGQTQAPGGHDVFDEARVRVWNNIAMRWPGAGAPPERGLEASVWGQLSRNAMPESCDIVSALVVFDRSAVEGLTLTQLADYATMRGLSHTRPASGD